MKKLLSLAAAAFLVGGLLSLPASAATAPKKAAMHKTHHMKSCYDYAWDSQAQKDCLAGKSAKPMMKKASSKSKSMKKAPAKKTS